MDKQISPKITTLTLGILVLCFAVAFYVVAWQEPSQAPPQGNVPVPVNVGPDHQTKQGDLSIGTIRIRGDGSISTYLNGDKLDSYHAADLLAAGGGNCYVKYNNNPASSPECPSGWTKEDSLGIWGYCVYIADYHAGNDSFAEYFPPGGRCPSPGGAQNMGQASLCCK